MAASIAATSEPPTVAVCKLVSKVYLSSTGPVRALQEVDAVFRASHLAAIMGPSGSGKSSLLRILAGLDRPSSGSIRVLGHRLSAMGSYRRRRVRKRYITYVFQRPSDNLISYLTVAEHMRLAAELRPPSDVGEAEELLDLLGMAHRKDNRPHELSGGEQQRLAFGQAVVGGPALVVADEPTAELDATSASSLVEVMRRLAHRGTAVVVATHDPAVAREAATTIRLEQGRRVE